MQQAPLHVLVVEDEVVNRDVVCQILNYFGHQVTAVDSGMAALNAVRDAHYNVVVMDCRMHDMDGLETTRRLRAGEAGPDGIGIPIIALTAQAFAVDRDACTAWASPLAAADRMVPSSAGRDLKYRSSTTWPYAG